MSLRVCKLFIYYDIELQFIPFCVENKIFYDTIYIMYQILYL